MSGHAFLVFWNKSSGSEKVGAYTVGKGQGVTIGTWGNKKDGAGVYYDLEAWFASNHGGVNKVYPGNVSLTIDLTKSQVSRVSTDITRNNTWNYAQNCAWFASKVWTDVAPKAKQVNAGKVVTPTQLASAIKKVKGHAKGVQMPRVTAASQVKSGKGKAASSGTLKYSSASASNSK